ncbi:MAG: hypothetical protein AB8F94_08535 [Saprospiraceae bacterium]
MLLIFTSCANDSNNKNGKATSENQAINWSSLIGKWKVSDSNPILEGTIISEYFKDNTFKQNGVITSFQPNYTCQMTSNGTYSISNNILSYSYLAEEMFDCKPEEYQLMVNSYMGNKQLETSQNKIIKLDDKVMIQENLETNKQLTFTRVVE